MWNFLAPPAFKPEQTGSEADERYRRLRWQVFIGIFIGYAGFYIVRKNFSMAIPMLAPFGFEKGELGVVLSMNAIAYGFSKFVMASISDRSNAQRFLPLGLILAAISMMFMIVPVQWIGADNKGLAIALMAVLNFLVGWFNGMGWPPCGRVMTHWFSIKERGTWMSFWNCAHNVGGALVGPMAVYGAAWFGSWFYGADEKSYFLIGTYLFPAAVAILIAIIAYSMIRDTPQSCGLSSIEKWRNDYADTYDEKSEKVFHGRRALPTILFMIVVAVLIVIYWQNFTNINVVIGCLIGIGFFIYGPVMLIGVQALDLAPKNVAGTAAGLTGFMGYVLGTALLANVVIGYVAESAGWDWTFVLLIGACVLSVLFMALTYKKEQYLVKNK